MEPKAALKRACILVLLVLGTAMTLYGQKSRVMAVLHMIDQKNFRDAKEEIELAAWNEKTARWPRTYFAKGLLCQSAYEEGKKNNDDELMNLYPDQLYVAYNAYRRALELDVRGRLENLIAQRFHVLYNHFNEMGIRQFSAGKYSEAFQAFEHALMISQTELVEAPLDTGLVYNTAMAAFESGKWDKAVGYLTGLHESAYRPSVSLYLYQSYQAMGDTAGSEKVLSDAAAIYQYDPQVVMYLINVLVEKDSVGDALEVLEKASMVRPGEHRFPWSRGLIYERKGEYDEALTAFQQALELSPDHPKICYHIGLVHYNKAIDLREQSMQIRENAAYRRMKQRIRAQFTEAHQWFQRAAELDPADREISTKLNQLEYQLRLDSRAGSGE